MTRFLKAAFRFIFDHAGWKLLSLAAAVAIWALVASEPELSTFTSTQVEYKNLPSDLEIASTPVTTVLLELHGPSGELQSLGGGAAVHPQIIIDMSSAAAGEHTYAIADGAVRLPKGVQLLSALPSQVHFTFEPRSLGEVPVRVRFTGEGRHGYVIASQSITPATVKIEGAASHVAAAEEAVTDPVDVSDVVGTSTFRVSVFLADPFVRIISTPQVSVTVTMKKK